MGYTFLKYSDIFSNSGRSVTSFNIPWRSYETVFYTLFMCGHYLFITGLEKSAFSTYLLGKLVFRLSAFLCLCRCQILCDFVLTFSMTIQIIIMPLQRSWVNLIYEEKCGARASKQNERVSKNILKNQI